MLGALGPEGRTCRIGLRLAPSVRSRDEESGDSVEAAQQHLPRAPTPQRPGGRHAEVTPGPVALLMLLLPMLPADAARGHPVFTAFVQHRAVIRVSGRNIDLQIELTFFEIRSMAERRRMDADHDGRISPAEQAAYCRRMAAYATGRVRLQAAGSLIEPAVLFDPELDLLGVDEIAPVHHVLRFFFFARTPALLPTGSEIVVQESLWAQAPALLLGEAAGSEGFEVHMLEGADAVCPAAEADSWREVRAVCTRAPQMRMAALQPSAVGGAGLRTGVAAGAAGTAGMIGWSLVRVRRRALRVRQA